jgi:hypothetical protein
MSRDELEKLATQMRTMARICDPKNNASDGERGNAARGIEALLPRLIDAATRKAPTPQPPPPRSPPPPSPSSALNEVLGEWYKHFPKALTSDQKYSLARILARMPRDRVVDAVQAAVRASKLRGLDDPFRYFCGVCWNQIKAAA